MTVFILMGVSGSGKTTIGKRVAQQLALPFLEGDDFHPQRNIDKMSSGIPLTDEDRMPWIDALVAAINAHPSEDLIVACSALSRRVRERLRSGLQLRPCFLFLTADPSIIQARLDKRGRHYMKPGMLGSQLAALEPPPDAVEIDVSASMETVTAQVAREIQARRNAS